MGLSICVFCASASGLPEVYLRAARELGAELARRGHRLVYGGGNVGLMGELARSVHLHGGTVFGAPDPQFWEDFWAGNDEACLEHALRTDALFPRLWLPGGWENGVVVAVLMCLPVWVAIISLSLLFATSRAAWLWLAGANLACFGILWALRKKDYAPGCHPP